MKCYVSLNTNDKCVITRIDCEKPDWHKVTVKRSDFVNFWYKMVRIDKMVRWFQFMADDSFCAEWFDLDNSGLKTRECIFILDDSICKAGIRDYLKMEIEKYFKENQSVLQDRCDYLERCLATVQRNENRLIKAIRKYDETGSLSEIESIVSLKEFNTILELFGKKWSCNRRLFSDRNMVAKTSKRWGWMALISFSLALISFFFTNINIFSIFCCFVMPCLFASWRMKTCIEAANEPVLEKLVKVIEESIDEKECKGEVKEKENNYEEEFLFAFVKEMIDYMGTLPSINFTKEKEELSGLCDDFPLVNVSHSYAEKVIYVSRLFDMEEEIYSKESRMGLSDYVSGLLDSNNLRARLEFVGLKREEIAQDIIFKMVVEALNIIKETPFFGCELEAIRLYRMCVSSMAERKIDEEAEVNKEQVKAEIERILKALERAKLYSALKSARVAFKNVTELGVGVASQSIETVENVARATIHPITRRDVKKRIKLTPIDSGEVK